MDTNIWVSALISPTGTPAALLRKLGGHILITSEEILEEVRRVLGYNRIADRYNVTSEIVNEYLDNIRVNVVLVVADSPDIPIVEDDPSDDKFLVCATNGRADYIVSGDYHLQRLVVYQGIPIVSPANMLESMDTDRSEKNDSLKGK